MPAYDDGSCNTLTADWHSPAIAVRTAQTTANGCGITSELPHTLDAAQPEAVAYAVRMREGCSGGGKGPLVQEEVSGTLATGNDQTIFDGGYIVRRLTPLECERLQGFPDGWTDITDCDADAVTEKVAASLHYDERKSATLLRKVRKWSQECPDGPRYKACGNSMAVPNMRWIFERIQAYDTMRETEVE